MSISSFLDFLFYAIFIGENESWPHSKTVKMNLECFFRAKFHQFDFVALLYRWIIAKWKQLDDY